MEAPAYIGTAAWNIPPQVKEFFPGEGTHLQRYARVLNAVEINSSFYRDHKPETYAKWANAVPADFRFSVKLSRHFTQETRLRETGSRLRETLQGISQLGIKWGALLVQLPPSLDFDPAVTKNFLEDLRRFYQGPLLWEPRHLSWISEMAVSLLVDYRVSKVLADPEPCRLNLPQRKNLEEVRYLRLHGSPEIYKSPYSQKQVTRIARLFTAPAFPAAQTWCIFDNTTYGYATENALELRNLLQKS